MTKPARISYAFMFVMLVLVGWLHLATPLITVLFSYLALTKLNFGRSRWLAVSLFILIVCLVGYGFFYFMSKAIVALPKIADSTIPVVLEYAQRYGLELPFDDFQSLKAMVLKTVQTEVADLGHYVRATLHQLVFLVIGIVVAVSIFLNSKFDLAPERHQLKNNLYSLTGAEIAARFRIFFGSFSAVMGAQFLISLINTALTAMFLLGAGLPHPTFVIGITFFCGLLPIIGNIISNSIVVGIALTISPRLAMIALVFLIVLHKLEYFLNSTIVGDRIKNPMWLTLLGLIVGERLMGVPGMIFAPVVLHYIKVEASQSIVTEEPGAGGDAGEAGPASPPATKLAA